MSKTSNARTEQKRSKTKHIRFPQTGDVFYAIVLIPQNPVFHLPRQIDLAPTMTTAKKARDNIIRWWMDYEGATRKEVFKVYGHPRIWKMKRIR